MDCTICADYQTFYIICCGASLCKNCVLKQKNTCPTCKRDLFNIFKETVWCINELKTNNVSCNFDDNMLTLHNKEQELNIYNFEYTDILNITDFDINKNHLLHNIVSNNGETVNLFIFNNFKNKININNKDNSNVNLAMAIIKYQKEKINELYFHHFKDQIDINAQNICNWTIPISVALKQSEKINELYFNYFKDQIDVNLKTNDGNNVIYYIIKYQSEKIVKLYLDHFKDKIDHNLTVNCLMNNKNMLKPIIENYLQSL